MERVSVIGSGVIGLGAALYFRQQGHSVRVYSHNATHFPTTPVSAAFWLPFACSMPPELEESLSAPTHEFLLKAVADSRSGVHLRTCLEYFDSTVGPEERIDPWWARLPQTQFAVLDKSDLPTHLQSHTDLGPFNGAWRFQVPVVPMYRFVPWLTSQAQQSGVILENRHVSNFSELENESDLILNCTGGWASWLTQDVSLQGMQGVVLEVEGEPFGDELLLIEKGRSHDLPTYIVPQRERTILGGTLKGMNALGERWVPGDRGPWTPSETDIQSVLERCCSLVKTLSPLRITNVKAGMRPCRIGLPPRIESDFQGRTPVIHNYGHGGSGVTTFWGSAIEAYSLGVGL